jgi:hypothetical protein
LRIDLPIAQPRRGTYRSNAGGKSGVALAESNFFDIIVNINKDVLSHLREKPLEEIQTRTKAKPC